MPGHGSRVAFSRMNFTCAAVKFTPVRQKVSKSQGSLRSSLLVALAAILFSSVSPALLQGTHASTLHWQPAAASPPVGHSEKRGVVMSQHDDDLAQKIEAAERINQDGNSVFKTNLYDAAAAKYLEASIILLEDAEQGREEVVPHICKILANRAAALLRVGCEREAYDACCTALRLDPKHEKARLRRAMASEGLGYHQDAVDDCDFLLALVGRESALGQQSLVLKRRVAKLAATKEGFVPFYQPGHLCSDEMTLRTYFSTPPPSAVPIGTFFTVSIYTANEFGLFDRQNLSESVHGVEVGFKSLGAGVELEARHKKDLVLDRRGRATFQLRFVVSGVGEAAQMASVSVGLLGGCIRGGTGVLDVASLHVKLLRSDGKVEGFERAVGGAWCARPLLLEGIDQPLLIAEVLISPLHPRLPHAYLPPPCNGPAPPSHGSMQPLFDRHGFSHDCRTMSCLSARQVPRSLDSPDYNPENSAQTTEFPARCGTGGSFLQRPWRETASGSEASLWWRWAAALGLWEPALAHAAHHESFSRTWRSMSRCCRGRLS